MSFLGTKYALDPGRIKLRNQGHNRPPGPNVNLPPDDRLDSEDSGRATPDPERELQFFGRTKPAQELR